MSDQPQERQVVIPGYLPLCQGCPFKDFYAASKRGEVTWNELQVAQAQNKSLTEIVDKLRKQVLELTKEEEEEPEEEERAKKEEESKDTEA